MKKRKWNKIKKNESNKIKKNKEKWTKQIPENEIIFLMSILLLKNKIGNPVHGLDHHFNL